MHLQRGFRLQQTSCDRPRTYVHRITASRRTCQRAYSSSNSSYSAGPAPGTQQDIVGGVFDLCIVTCSQVAQSVISRIADVVQSIAPPGAPRDRIEVSVKGCLFLLVLGLLKGVLNVVLLVGSLGLAVYTATQVFGWDAVVLRQGQHRPHAGSPQQRYQQHHEQGYRQQQQQQYHYQGQPGWQQQQQEPWMSWPMAGQADVVNVTRGTQR